MKSKHKEIFIFLASAGVLLLQIWARSWEFRFTQEMNLLNYGTAMLFPALMQTLINITSGLLLISLILHIGQGFSFELHPKPLQPISIRDFAAAGRDLKNPIFLGHQYFYFATAIVSGMDLNRPDTWLMAGSQHRLAFLKTSPPFNLGVWWVVCSYLINKVNFQFISSIHSANQPTLLNASCSS